MSPHGSGDGNPVQMDEPDQERPAHGYDDRRHPANGGRRGAQPDADRRGHPAAVLAAGYGRRPAFAAGWVVGIVVVVGLILLLAPPRLLAGPDDDPSTLAAVVKLLLGVALLALAVRAWRGRPRPGEAGEPPGWMASLGDASPLAAFGLGAALSGVNPKNLAFNVAAAVAILQARLPLGEALIPLAVYVLLASVGVAAPVAWFLIDRAGAARTLDGRKAWLTANNATVMAVVLLVLGVKQLGQGLGGLLG